MRRRPRIPQMYVDSVLKAVHELLRKAGIDSAPVDIWRLAQYQNVVEIRESVLGSTDAHLTPEGSGFVIELNAFANPQRKRFSIAHEIAHTFFNPVTRSYRRSRAVTVTRERPETLVEEYLCDIAASEMLMPEALFQPIANGGSPGISTIQQLATSFETSLEATALRYGTLGPKSVQVTAWRRNYSRILPKWNKGAPVLLVEPFRFREADSFVNWCVTKAYLTRKPIAAHDVEFSCYPPKRIWIEAQGFRQGSGRYVLSLMQSAFSASVETAKGGA